MCNAKPGLRCETHARQRIAARHKEIEDVTFELKAAEPEDRMQLIEKLRKTEEKMRNDLHEYNLTVGGQQQIQELIDAATNEEEREELTLKLKKAHNDAETRKRAYIRITNPNKRDAARWSAEVDKAAESGIDLAEMSQREKLYSDAYREHAQQYIDAINQDDYNDADELIPLLQKTNFLAETYKDQVAHDVEAEHDWIVTQAEKHGEGKSYSIFAEMVEKWGLPEDLQERDNDITGNPDYWEDKKIMLSYECREELTQAPKNYLEIRERYLEEITEVDAHEKATRLYSERRSKASTPSPESNREELGQEKKPGWKKLLGLD